MLHTEGPTTRPRRFAAGDVDSDTAATTTTTNNNHNSNIDYTYYHYYYYRGHTERPHPQNSIKSM